MGEVIYVGCDNPMSVGIIFLEDIFDVTLEKINLLISTGTGGLTYWNNGITVFETVAKLINKVSICLSFHGLTGESRIIFKS